MKVPLSVILGKSPMKTVCSFISPVFRFKNRARTNIWSEYVWSFSLHSFSENFGGPLRSSSSLSNSNSSSRLPVKSVIGLISANVSASPTARNLSNDFFWTSIRSGNGRTSSRLPNEYRSRAAREDNGIS